MHNFEIGQHILKIVQIDKSHATLPFPIMLNGQKDEMPNMSASFDSRQLCMCQLYMLDVFMFC